MGLTAEVSTHRLRKIFKNITSCIQDVSSYVLAHTPQLHGFRAEKTRHHVVPLEAFYANMRRDLLDDKPMVYHIGQMFLYIPTLFLVRTISVLVR